MGLKRAHLFINGRVQGVFYRAFTRDLAVSLGLSGWVRNLPDGRVEAVLEGDEEKIGEAIKQCYKGPPAAYVKDIDVEWEDWSGEFKGFQIRY